MKRKTITVGVLCFNEETNVLPVYNELIRVTNKNKKYNYELLYSDNGSTDKTREEIRKIAARDKRVSGICLSRNFGPEPSGQALLDHSSGDAFVMYEGDMQDPANIILDFIKQWEKGFDVVVGVREKIDDFFLMAITRKLYYKIFKTISNIEVPVNAGSFGLMDKKVVEAMNKLPEKYRFFRGLRAWVGFKTSYILYERKKRLRGKSSYNLLKYLQLAERSFFGFSYLPLDIMVYTGFFIVFISFIAGLVYFLSRMILVQSINESVIIMFIVILFGGVQLLALSIIGKYVQVIVEETKARPIYIVEEIIKHGQTKE